MSTIVMAACWPLQGMSPAQKAVLISLADQANDDGVCWPSVNTIGLRTCLSERAVQAALKWLEEHGALVRDRRAQRSTMYTVTPQALAGQVTRAVHYVYRVTHTPSGRFYIGLRTCGGDPLEEDRAYLGSGVSAEWLMKRRDECVKEIVATFEQRLQAAQFESSQIAAAIDDPKCLNRKVSGPGSGMRARGTAFDPADAAPADPAPADAAPHPAASAPLTPQQLHLGGAASAPGTVKEPSAEPPVEPLPPAPPPAKPAKAAKAATADEAETALQAACRATWAAYSDAYEHRYRARPVRNAQVNAKVKLFVQRLGYEEAPKVARFYVEGIHDPFVTRECHPVGTLLQKAEGYRTQWAAGPVVQAGAGRASAANAGQYQPNVHERRAATLAGLTNPGDRHDDDRVVDAEARIVG